MAILSVSSAITAGFIQKLAASKNGSNSGSSSLSGKEAVKTTLSGIQNGVKIFSNSVAGLNSMLSTLNVTEDNLKKLSKVTDEMILVVRDATQTGIGSFQRSELDSTFRTLVDKFQTILTKSASKDFDTLQEADLEKIFKVLGFDKQKSSTFAALIKKFTSVENSDGQLSLVSDKSQAARPIPVPAGAYKTLVTSYGSEGNGSFALRSTFTEGTANTYSDMQFKDIDADGNIDILALQNNKAIVRMGNGDGTFQVSKSYTVGNTSGGQNPANVVLVDVTGDSKLDILTGNPTGGTIKAYLSVANADGSFSAPGSYSLAAGADAATSIDYGYLGAGTRGDVVVGAGTNIYVGISGTGSAFTGSTFAGANPSTIKAVQVANIDGTGANEIVTVSNTNVSIITTGQTDASNNSVHLDGTDDYISVGASATLDNMTSFTYSVRVNMDDLTTVSGQRLFSRNFGALQQNIAIDAGGGIVADINYSTSNAVSYSTSPLLTTGGWHTITVAHDSATKTSRIYLDGSEATTYFTQTAGVGTINTQNGSTLEIGGPGADADRDVDGYLDDARVYNRALSATEIAEIAQGETNTSGLRGWWKFDEGAGTTTADSSGNGNTATLVNGVAWDASNPTVVDSTPQSATSYAITGSSIENFSISDFDGNGANDIAVTNSTNGTVQILLNNGNGTFLAAVSYRAGTASAGSSSVTAVDLDGDSIEDLVVTNPGDKTISVLLGNSNGTFKAPVSSALWAAGSTAAVGDANGDGREDVIVGVGSSDRYLYAEGQPAITTTTAQTANTRDYDFLFDVDRSIAKRPDAFRMLADLEKLKEQLDGNLKAIDDAFTFVIDNIYMLRSVGLAFLSAADDFGKKTPTDVEGITRIVQSKLRNIPLEQVRQLQNLDALTTASLSTNYKDALKSS